jgi:hypothetical protein
MREFKIGSRVFWFEDTRKCEGEVVDIYVNRSGQHIFHIQNGNATDANTLLIQIENGRKLLKSSAEVSLLDEENNTYMTGTE